MALPMPVLHEDMAQEEQLSFLHRYLLVQPDLGSVVEACVAFVRRSPWKSTQGLPGSSGGGGLRREALLAPQASISAPTTVK
ncbi:MAG: hypothetical protein Q8L77_10245 [Nitrospirota bacterium]|nr:hypothetical protein [Nitrospirota bacterium]